MGQVKSLVCECIPCQYPKFSLKGVHPDWEMHPSWISGIEALNAYNFWVSEVLLPIAFQWIDEHKPEVYARVPEHLKGDVGVVIAAAFELVKELPAYKKGMEEYKIYKEAVENGTWDSSRINPVWTGIVRSVRTATEEVFASQSDVLKDTVR
jgi:hypothetical protein